MKGFKKRVVVVPVIMALLVGMMGKSGMNLDVRAAEVPEKQTLAQAGTGMIANSVTGTTNEEAGPGKGVTYEEVALSDARLSVNVTWEEGGYIQWPAGYELTADNLTKSPLAVAFWVYSSSAVSLGDGQLELNSSGKKDDSNEIRYMVRDMAALEQGWNYIVFPIKLFQSAGTVDLNKVNYLYFYTDKLTGTFRVTDMELIVMAEDHTAEWTVADAFLYDSSRKSGSGYSFNNGAIGKMGITEGLAGEPEAGTVYAETMLANKALSFSRTLDSPIPDAYKMTGTADLASSKLAVSFWVYSSVEGASLGDGQLELTSSGKRNDSSEIRYKLTWLPALKAGWNYLELPLSSFAYTETGGAVDMQNLNYLNFYTAAVNGANLTGTFRITDIKIVSEYTVVEKHSDASAGTAPEAKEGYVFAGWYMDEDCTKPLAQGTANVEAYAKYVDKSVLDVKAQISTLKDGEEDVRRDIRFVTTVDTEHYSRVGFKISIGDKVKKISSNRVYRKLYAVDSTDKQLTEYKPAEAFSCISQYFNTYTLRNVPKESYATEITVTPYWITCDGTTVYGSETVKSVSMGIDQ